MANLFLTRWAKLYSNPTPAERALEPAVAALGIPYRFQHPLWALRVFPDFALPSIKVAIEVDDPGHRRADRRRRDFERTARMAAAGWKVVRVTNQAAEDFPRESVARMMREAGHPDLAAKVEV